ncbi:putative spore germination protein GerPF [Bacillus sp. THAF10]|uniref:spore germination protein n=1 Tax=Bacillus sp. THAF10 TaxID=2587848 RepID=UPI0012682F2A|nr:spore germination protein [Bacillus sp. THAF10]QFT89002.1 putative spore germination protein GerPF [Bacillus sp. THAF10]
MACIIKKVIIENVNGGVVNFGNIFKACPITVEKGVTGSGSGNLGKCIKTSTKISIVNICGKKHVKVIDEIGDGFD